MSITTAVTLPFQLLKREVSLPGLVLYMGDPRHTRLGYWKSRLVDWKKTEVDEDLTGQVHMVVGANAGVGYAAALELARKGATVHMLCRSKERGEKAMQRIVAATANQSLRLHIVDLSHIAEVKTFGERFAAEEPRLDVLVNNAAVMMNSWNSTPEGLEVCVATNVIGYYVLTEALIPLLKSTGQTVGVARMVNVVSAGLYLQKLDVDFLQELITKRSMWYEGVRVYSQCHRARMVLTSRWADQLKADNVVVNAVHPGWVDTPGLQNAGPMYLFYKLTYPLLRTEEEGADSMVWLAASKEAAMSTGKFIYDRSPRATSLPLANTEPTSSDVDSLLTFCHGAYLRATGDVGTKSEGRGEKGTKVHFEVSASVASDEIVLVVGSAPELGQWDPHQGVSMRRLEDDRWAADVTFTLTDPAEFKYVVSKSHDRGWCMWEHTPSNRHVQPSKGLSLNHKLHVESHDQVNNMGATRESAMAS